jgi:hypothetical protein
MRQVRPDQRGSISGASLERISTTVQEANTSCRWRSSHVRHIQMMLRLAHSCGPRCAITAGEVHSWEICELYALPNVMIASRPFA